MQFYKVHRASDIARERQILHLQEDRSQVGSGLWGCMIQVSELETIHHASTAMTVGGPGWPSITFASITASRFSRSQFFGAFCSITSKYAGFETTSLAASVPSPRMPAKMMTGSPVTVS